jgi:hypothetical protein
VHWLELERKEKQIERISVDSDVAVRSMTNFLGTLLKGGVSVLPGPKILDGCPHRRCVNIDADCATVF